MNLAIIIVVSAVLALATILSVAVTQTLQARRSTNLAGSIRPIDIDAFRNLINPIEDEYLRRRLPPSQFRMVRRERLRARLLERRGFLAVLQLQPQERRAWRRAQQLLRE